MILCVTPNTAVDRTLVVPGYGAAGVFRPQQMIATIGGKGVNVAAALRMLGVEVAVTGFLGSENDELFADFFATESIDDRFVRLDGVTCFLPCRRLHSGVTEV